MRLKSDVSSSSFLESIGRNKFQQYLWFGTLPLIKDSLKNSLNRSFVGLGFLESRRVFSLHIDKFIPSLIK